METDSITITSILNIKQILDKKNQISKIICEKNRILSKRD